MRYGSLRSAVVVLVALALPAIVSAANAPTIITPSQVHWAAAPSMGAGVEMARIFGNPADSGPYVFRLRLRDGVKFPPHYHNDTERVTVLSGTLLVGLGDRMDASRMMALPAGSIVSIPAGVHHYAMSRGVTILQLDGMGPFEMKAVTQK
jgi:quercetin dioxygenase-like cupin family protein